MEPANGGLLLRMLDWVEQQPDWLRPVIYGPILLAYGILLKGGIVLIPLAIYFAFAGAGGAVLEATFLLGFLFASAAIAGLVYSIVGRPLRAVPGVGRYAAGVVTLVPYMAAGGALINVSDGGRLLDPWTDSLLVASIFCCVLFGFVIGHFWFDD
jgi:hypothetical protein